MWRCLPPVVNSTSPKCSSPPSTLLWGLIKVKKGMNQTESQALNSSGGISGVSKFREGGHRTGLSYQLAFSFDPLHSLTNPQELEHLDGRLT